MPTAQVYLQLMYACSAVVSLYGASQSYVAIVNLRKYEETTKKLAKWSDEVGRQLYKTRETQAIGAILVLVSFLTAGYMAVLPQTLPRLARALVSPGMLIVTVAARYRIKYFWASGDGKTVGTRIPLPNMEDYNEAQRRTEELLKTLEYLEYGWVGTSFVAGMPGFK